MATYEVTEWCGGENRNPLLNYLCFRAHLQGREPLGWQVRQRDMLVGCPGTAPTPPHTGEHQEIADGPHQNKRRTEVGPVGVFSTRWQPGDTGNTVSSQMPDSGAAHTHLQK